MIIALSISFRFQIYVASLKLTRLVKRSFNKTEKWHQKPNCPTHSTSNKAFAATSLSASLAALRRASSSAAWVFCKKPCTQSCCSMSTSASQPAAAAAGSGPSADGAGTSAEDGAGADPSAEDAAGPSAEDAEWATHRSLRMAVTAEKASAWSVAFVTWVHAAQQCPWCGRG